MIKPLIIQKIFKNHPKLIEIKLILAYLLELFLDFKKIFCYTIKLWYNHHLRLNFFLKKYTFILFYIVILADNRLSISLTFTLSFNNAKRYVGLGGIF